MNALTSKNEKIQSTSCIGVVKYSKKREFVVDRQSFSGIEVFGRYTIIITVILKIYLTTRYGSMYGDTLAPAINLVCDFS